MSWPLLFTTATGEVIEQFSSVEKSTSLTGHCGSTSDCHPPSPVKELTTTAHNLVLPIRKPYDLDGHSEIPLPLSPTPNTAIFGRSISSCKSTTPLVQIVGPDKLPYSSSWPRPSTLSKGEGSHPLNKPKSSIKIRFLYNDYGELVDEKEFKRVKTTNELNVVQILRIIKEHYHHELRSKLDKIIVLQSDGISSILVDDCMWKYRLTSWDFRPPSPNIAAASPASVINSPMRRRVLEIGCSDGSWCFNFKKELPDWIVEGVDYTDHWNCSKDSVLVKDFMAQPAANMPADYFSNIHRIQETPEFTVRNLNHFLTHDRPFPHNHYEFIRAREIFDRIESYKSFLDDVRSILKPDGVVEFLEIDPRPRASAILPQRNATRSEHKSVAETDWTDNIEDRFKDPLDQEIATTTPGWTARVAERLKASLRPQDGVPAAQLKSWLEGAGFWDVKQLIKPIQVGGDTRPGQLLRQFIKYEVDLENEIPKLRDELPKIELDDVENGAYYLNLHVVTGRKPQRPRPGDLLPNGERQEMTASKYDAMARLSDAKSSQWKRFDLDGKLTSMMYKLTTIPRLPDTIKMATPSESDSSLYPMIGRHSDIETPFHAPPFVKVLVKDPKAVATTNSSQCRLES